MTDEITPEAPDLPHTLQIEVTSRCNLKCTMCALTRGQTLSGQQPGHMSQAVWERVRDQAIRTGEVIISGYGEPFTHPGYLAMLRELDETGVRFGMSTNGILLTPTIAGQLAQFKHLVHVNVSIDSPDPTTYRKIRGCDLDRALAGLHALRSTLRESHRITVSSVLTPETIHSLIGFPRLLAKYGVRRYVIQGLAGVYTDLEPSNSAWGQDASNVLLNLMDACRNVGVELRFTLPDRLNLELQDPIQAQQAYYQCVGISQEQTRQCFLPWENPYIDKDGRVFPCCYAATSPDAVLGSIMEQGIEDIWHGAAYRDFRRRLLNGIMLPDVCRKCTVVPWGEHPLRRYSARILEQESVLRDQIYMRLVVQNTGTAVWTGEPPIRIGTATPRDHESPFYQLSWDGLNRIGTFSENRVPSGGVATFRFRVRPAYSIQRENLQLVVEGQTWLPNTKFQLYPNRTQENPITRLGYAAGLRIWHLALAIDHRTRRFGLAGLVQRMARRLTGHLRR